MIKCPNRKIKKIFIHTTSGRHTFRYSHENGHDCRYLNEHVHDADCGCNHVHQHQNSHNHSHSGETVESQDNSFTTRKPITITHHDGAMIGSLQFQMNGTYDEVLLAFEVCMLEVARKVQHHDGLIDHIKGYVVGEKNRCMLSITDDHVEKKYIKEQSAEVTGAVIVFGLDEGTLGRILKDTFAEWC